jgi:ABC-type multidrug transport system ATPase subunit
MNKILEVKNLNKSFGNFKAVDNLSFDVFDGDIYGFLGPNGAGKSTTIRMIMGLIYPDSGSIKLIDQEITPTSRNYLSQIGALIERPDFYGNLSAYDNLKLMAELSNVPNAANRIMEVLELVHLEKRKKSNVKTFSQGMKQRMGIAQAILHKPKFVILDEPSNGLDPQGQADIRKIIQSINKDDGITILFSSHILTEVEEICNRMIIINNGQNIREGNVIDLMNEEKLNVTIKSKQKQEIYQFLLLNNYSTRIVNDLLFVELPEKLISKLIAELVQNKFELDEVNQNRSLESYFLKIVQN